jgi:hypothetical protein
MATPEVEEFAKLLMTHVRDMAISTSDMSLDPDANGPTAKRWRLKMQAGQIQGLLSEMIPDCVDNALFYLLYAIDEGLLRISFTGSSGRTVDLTEAGESEMAGWYMATDGWRHAHSKERFVDDLRETE